MVMLSQHVSAEELRALDNAIVASIPPGDDGAVAVDHGPGDEHRGPVGAVRRGAGERTARRCSPGSWGWRGSVLEPVRYDALTRRLGD